MQLNRHPAMRVNVLFSPLSFALSTLSFLDLGFLRSGLAAPRRAADERARGILFLELIARISSGPT